MTDFDNLLKEKAEQADYPYRASAWKRFADKAGIRAGLTTGQIVTLGLATVAMAGGITWAVIGQNDAPPAATPEPPTEIVLQDTVISAPAVLSPAETVETPAPTTPTQTVAAPVPTPEPTEIESQPSAKSAAQEKPRKVERVHGRPVTINVDTITQIEISEEELRNGHSRLY